MKGAVLLSFTISGTVTKCEYNTEVTDIIDENNRPTTKCPENASNISDVRSSSKVEWEEVVTISSGQDAKFKKDRIDKVKPKNANGTNQSGLTRKQERIAKWAQRNASRSENKSSQNSTKPRYKTIEQTRLYPELPKEYEEMVPTWNMTALLEISLWLNKYRETMNLFDDYADEVETETGLKISGRTKFMDEFDDYIHRAQYILKLRMYKLQ